MHQQVGFDQDKQLLAAPSYMDIHTWRPILPFGPINQTAALFKRTKKRRSVLAARKTGKEEEVWLTCVTDTW